MTLHEITKCPQEDGTIHTFLGPASRHGHMRTDSDTIAKAKQKRIDRAAKKTEHIRRSKEGNYQ